MKMDPKINNKAVFLVALLALASLSSIPTVFAGITPPPPPCDLPHIKAQGFAFVCGRFKLATLEIGMLYHPCDTYYYLIELKTCDEMFMWEITDCCECLCTLRVNGIPLLDNYATNEHAVIHRPGPGSICVSIFGLRKYGFVIAGGSGVFFMGIITQIGPIQVDLIPQNGLE